MPRENVEMLRGSYAAYNAAVSAPNPREANRAVWERFADPEIDWEVSAVWVEQQIFHGIDGVMEFFELILDAFQQVHQVPERFIECGDHVLVFVRTESRGRTTGLELNQQ